MDTSGYKSARQRYIEAIVSDDFIAVFTAHHAMQQTADMSAPYEQERNFLWLTGINQAGWRLVIRPEESVLIAPDVADEHRLFDGALSNDEATKISGIERVLSRKEGEKYIAQHAKRAKKVFALGEEPHADHYDFILNPARQELWDELKKIADTVTDTRPTLSKLRALKTDKEIANIRRAIEVSVAGFEEVKELLSTTQAEYEIEATLSSAFRRTGAEGHAYAPIVASGIRACTLHYGKNSEGLEGQGQVLIDAGAKWQGFASDITRTYALGEPSQRLKDVHAAVERAHVAIIETIAPGVPLKKYIAVVDEIMKRELKTLGLLKKATDYRRYFPHAVSHGLGLDVHESLGGYKEFQPGMVLTVEPGIYIPEEGIGVRIEDDILVTADGRENLSGALPTTL